MNQGIMKNKLSRIILVLCVLSVFLLSACINVSVDQKLKRSGNFDISLTISTSSEYAMLLNMMRTSFEVDDSIRHKLSYTETDTSFTYHFKDVDPKKDKLFFKDVDKTAYPLNLYGESNPYFNLDQPIINPETFSIHKEFKFPYYEYTYTFKSAQKTEVDKEFELLTHQEYVVDEANLLSPEEKTIIIDLVNEVFRNHSVEIIVNTKHFMEQSEYNSYYNDFRRNFKFKSEDKYFVYIFTSTNTDGVCRVTTNVYNPYNFTTQVNTLNRDFMSSCENVTSQHIMNTIFELDKIFSRTTITSTINNVQDQISNFFKIGYTVEVFGSITETNGLKIGNNKVKFDVNPMGDDEYYVVYKDFFLSSMLGNLYWLFYSIFGLIIIGVVFYEVLLWRKKNRPKSLLVPVAINPMLSKYVSQAKKQSMSDEEIMNALTQNGWSTQDISLALKEVK